jgi:hypothetical protein
VFAFCAGLWDLELDIDHLTAVKDDQELRLEKEAEALRTIKAKNEQVWLQHMCCSAATLSKEHSRPHQTCKKQQTAYMSAWKPAAVMSSWQGTRPTQLYAHLPFASCRPGRSSAAHAGPSARCTALWTRPQRQQQHSWSRQSWRCSSTLPNSQQQQRRH